MKNKKNVALTAASVYYCAVAILFVATSVPSWAQKSDVGTLYAGNSVTGSLTAVNLVTLAFSSVATGGTAEGLTCGPDNGVYVALSGLFFGPRQIVRFNRDLSGESVVLDFASSLPLMSSGGPEGPGFGPSKELFFNTWASQGFLHTGSWMLPTPGATPVQVMLPFVSNLSNAEGTAFSAASKLSSRRNVLAVDAVDGTLVRGVLPFSSTQPGFTFISGLAGPNGVAVDASGNIRVAEFFTGFIKKFSATGTFLSMLPTPSSTLLKIAFDARGNLYAAAFDGRIFRITPSGAITTVFNVSTEGNGVAVCPNVVIAVSPSTVSLSSTPTINVSILSGPTFHAPVVVDRSTLTFGKTGDDASLLSCAVVDVNGDGIPDLSCNFATPATDFQVGDTIGVLEGQVKNGGTWFQATAPVTINP